MLRLVSSKFEANTVNGCCIMVVEKQIIVVVEEVVISCDLKQFIAAIGTYYLPQVQTKPRDFASPSCLRFVFWNH